MILHNGYALSYNKSRNQIIISLPPTYRTLTSTTVEPIDRLVDVPELRLVVLLSIVEHIFQPWKGEREDDVE